jgi:hypothetical protein
VEGNKIVDQLAKSGTKKNYSNIITNLVYLGSQIKCIKVQEWELVLEVYKNTSKQSINQTSYLNIYLLAIYKRIAISINTKKATTNIFFQLKLRYNYLKSYLYRLGLVASNKYNYSKIETIKYLLLSCPLFKRARVKLKDNLNLNHLDLQLLLNITIGIEASISFINEIRIYTRKYYLARELEED